MVDEESTEPPTTDPSTESQSAPPEPTAKPPHQSRGGFAVLRVLRHPEFAIFWGGQAVSLVGTWMQNFAQGWVVAGMSSSALSLGLINFAASIPTLLLMPLGGIAADRMERRTILVYSSLAMGIVASITGFLIGGNQLQFWHLIVLALLLGSATAYELPAYQSFYPQLISKEELPQAIALNQATFNGARIIGPALAAAFVAAWGTAAAFHANALSFLAVLISLYFIKRRPPANTHKGGSAGKMFKEGLAYVKERPVVGALLGVTALTTLCVFPNLAVLMPYYVKHVLHLKEAALGTIMSISGLGSLIGALLLLNVPRSKRVHSIGLSGLAITIGLVLMAGSRSLWFAVAAIALISTSISFSVGLASIMIQESVPDQLRGRVMSLFTLTFTGIMPFAALAVTGLADRFTMPVELLILTTIYGVGMLLLVSRLWTHRKEIAAD